MRTLNSIIKQFGGVIQTGPFGSQLKQSEYSEQGIPVVMPKDICDGVIGLDRVARVSENKADQLSRHFLKEGSIVFPRRGDIGKCALITDKEVGFLCGTGCIKIEFPKEQLDPQFFYYFLIQSHVTEWLERNAIGSTMLNLNTSIIGRIPIPILDISQQRFIAAILKRYDDLIENNRRRIQLLEESTRLLFQEWFVYLRFPGHEHVKVVNGVPEGWRKSSLGELVEVKKGKNITKETVKVGNIPVVAGGLQPAYFHNVANAKGPVITISASGANAGYVNLYHEDVWASDCSYINKNVTDNIYYFYLQLKIREKEIFGMQKGAAQPHVYPKDLARLLVYEPSQSLIIDFEENVFSSFNLIKNLLNQNVKLVKARDILLPRLMNGTIAV